MCPFPVAFPGMLEILPKVDLNLILSKRLIIKMGAEKTGSPGIPVQGGSLPSLKEKENPLTRMGWPQPGGCRDPDPRSALRQAKAHARQSPGAGP